MKSPLELKRELLSDLRRLGGVDEKPRIIEYAVGPFVPPGAMMRAGGRGARSLIPTYSLIATAASINEGASVTFILTTTNVANGTAVPYVITGVSLADLVGETSLSGSFVVNNGVASITLTTDEDVLTEGPESIIVTLFGISPAVAAAVTINDTSLAPPGSPTYVLTSDVASVDEGGTFTVTLTTTNVADGTLVPYTITGVDSADIEGASLTGNFTINSGTASISFTATNDFTTEGPELFGLTLDAVPEDVFVTINDTSLTPVTLAEIFTGETTGGVVTVLESQFDAADGLNFTPSNPLDGQTFTQWSDSNSGTHNANPVGGATTRASYQSGTGDLQNSLAVVRFDGNDGLSINPYPGLASKSGVSIFMVSKMAAETASVNNSSPRLFSTNVANGIALYYNSTTNRWTVASATGVGESTQTNDPTGFHIHTLLYDGTQTGNALRLKYLYDGVEDTLSYTGTVGTTTSASINTLYIGNNNSNNFFTGDIAEFLIFTRALADNEVQGVLNYLNNKWGL